MERCISRDNIQHRLSGCDGKHRIVRSCSVNAKRYETVLIHKSKGMRIHVDDAINATKGEQERLSMIAAAFGLTIQSFYQGNRKETEDKLVLAPMDSSPRLRSHGDVILPATERRKNSTRRGNGEGLTTQATHRANPGGATSTKDMFAVIVPFVWGYPPTVLHSTGRGRHSGSGCAMRQAVVKILGIFAQSLHRPSQEEVDSGTHCLATEVLQVWWLPSTGHRSQRSNRQSRAIPKVMADILDIFSCKSPNSTRGHENTSLEKDYQDIMRPQWHVILCIASRSKSGWKR